MKIYRDINLLKNIKNPVVTTGTFDGVHLGHLQIINRLKEVAERTGGETVLLTFSPHPRLVLFPDDRSLRLLNTEEEKIDLLEKAGIEHLIIYPFTKEFSELSSSDFIKNILVDKIGTKKLVIGYDHHFGKNREGSFENLKKFGPKYGFEVQEIPAKDIDDVNVSSSKIRTGLQQGDIETANKYLGYQYSVTGKVVRGKQLGKELGYPTANIEVSDAYKLIPKTGIYAVRIKYKNDNLSGMMSIGFNPTVGGEKQTIEVNIFDFNKDIYGEELTVSFVKRLREEEKFESLEALKLQMKNDEIKSLEILGIEKL